MKFFIAINGKVYAWRKGNKLLPKLDIENNLFDYRDDAWHVVHELEEQHPRIFYGKPATKDGLKRYARGDTTATYRKRT